MHTVLFPHYRDLPACMQKHAMCNVIVTCHMLYNNADQVVIIVIVQQSSLLPLIWTLIFHSNSKCTVSTQGQWMCTSPDSYTIDVKGWQRQTV